MDKEKAVQGVAIYAEFARSGATTQLIICPDGYDNAGNLVPAKIVRRTISEATPKKQWKFTTLNGGEPGINEPGNVDDYAKANYADERMRYAATLFDQLLRGEWKMVKRPILVEISRKDYDSIYVGKTPTKLLYRISQSRIALDYPENLINNEVAVPAASAV